MIQKEIYDKDKDTQYKIKDIFTDYEHKFEYINIFRDSDIQDYSDSIICSASIEEAPNLSGNTYSYIISKMEIYDTENNTKIGNLASVINFLITESEKTKRYGIKVCFLTDDTVKELESLNVDRVVNRADNYNYMYHVNTESYRNLYLK